MATKAMVGDLAQKQAAQAQRAGVAKPQSTVSNNTAIPNVQGNQTETARPGLNMKKVAIVAVIVGVLGYLAYRKFSK